VFVDSVVEVVSVVFVDSVVEVVSVVGVVSVVDVVSVVGVVSVVDVVSVVGVVSVVDVVSVVSVDSVVEVVSVVSVDSVVEVVSVVGVVSVVDVVSVVTASLMLSAARGPTLPALTAPVPGPMSASPSRAATPTQPSRLKSVARTGDRERFIVATPPSARDPSERPDPEGTRRQLRGSSPRMHDRTARVQYFRPTGRDTCDFWPLPSQVSEAATWTPAGLLRLRGSQSGRRVSGLRCPLPLTGSA
jgi:hypothetical protein